MMNAIRTRSVIDEEEIAKVDAYLEEHHCKAVTYLDEEYPKALKNATQPPLVLFYKGDIGIIADERKCVAIIGSRDVNEYSKQATEELATSASQEGLIVVSGLSKGIGEIAIRNADKPVAVLGNGFDKPYPADCSKLYEEVANKGLLISEYPPEVQAESKHFPYRNRIIAGIAKAIIVPKARKHSGTLIAVSYALNMGKDVYVVPHSIYDEDDVCNELIQQGALPIVSSRDLSLITA